MEGVVGDPDSLGEEAEPAEPAEFWGWFVRCDDIAWNEMDWIELQWGRLGLTRRCASAAIISGVKAQAARLAGPLEPPCVQTLRCS
jgi:hypothetical protein